MDTQDQRKTAPSGHEIHGVHLCHKCGWPFPNPHPSAKHRRAHKRICGTVKGYKLIDSGGHTHSAVSDDEHGSDEDLHSPSPKIEKKGTNEFSGGGIGERSNRSEDEVFSDAVTEFSYGAFSPANEELLGGARVSDKNVENVVEGDPGTNQQFKVDATVGVVQLPNSPTDSSQMHNPCVLETETNLLGSVMPVEDIVSSCNSDSVVSSNSRAEELSVGLSSVNGSAGDLSNIKSETLTDSLKGANVGDCEMQSSMMLLEQETDVKGSEESNGDEVLSDAAITPSQTTSEAFVVACKLQETDLKTSDSVTVDQIVESKGKQIHEFEPVMSLHNLSPEVKSSEHMEVLVNTDHIESDSVQDRDVGNHGDSVEGSCIKGEGNENVHVLSVANDIPVVDHPEIMVEDFKDHRAVKFVPVAVDSDKVIEPVVDDNKDTFYEKNNSSFLSNQSGEHIHLSSAELHALEGNLKQEDGGNKVLVAELPAEGADASELNLSSEDLGSNGVEAPPETTMSGKIQTDSHLEGQPPHEFHTDSSQDILPESSTMGLADVIPVAISASNEVSHKTNLSGGNNAYSHEKDKTEKGDTDGKESGELVKVEPSTNIKTSSESVNDLSVSEVYQTTNFIGAGNRGDPEKAATEISDLAGNESRDMAVQKKPEMNSKMTLESACNLSESKVVVDDGRDEIINLKETETTTYFVSDSRDVGPDASHLGIITPTHSGSQSQQDEDSQEAIKEPKFNSKNEALAESVVAVCKDAKSNNDSGAEASQKISDIPPEHLPADSGFSMKSSATVDDSHCRDGVLGVSGTSTEYLQEGGENFTKQPIEGPTVDVSVDSSSQTDSLEGHWGSVSVLSTQSDAVAAINAEALPSTASKALAQSEMLKPITTSEGHHSNKSDVFEPPSFMTLVEPGDGVDQKAASSDIQMVQNALQPKSEAQQAGWLPSLTNVVNQSQGRKKNEEIIAKVTNWSTGKQHIPLKSLLSEANLETKPKSPIPKQTPTVTKKDENTTKNNDGSAATVNSILGPEAPTDQVAKRETGREWNSPARYHPSDDKKEKRKVKGRPYWVPFVCCSSVN